MQIYIDDIDKSVPSDLNPNYEYIENIAHGAFGTVIHVYDKISNIDLAIKVINKSGQKINLIHKMKEEIIILKQLEHKNIVKYFGFEETNSNLFIIMEFIKYGTLKEFMRKNKGKIKEEEVSLIIKQILSATEYLHNKLICHRDIKPENIMFSKENDLNSIKLIDFGLSQQNLFNPLLKGYCGTLIYMSPEQIEKKSYSQTIDNWSIGIILYMLLNNNKHPFYNKNDKREIYFEKIKNGNIKFEKNISYMAKNLICKLLEVNPSWRYSSEKAIRHPFITREKYDEIPKTFNEILSFRNSQNNLKDIFLISIFLNFCKKNPKLLIKDKSLLEKLIYPNKKKDKGNKKIFKINDEYIKKCNYYSLEKKEKLKKIKDYGLEVINNNENYFLNERDSIKRLSTKLNSVVLKNLKKQNSIKEKEKDNKLKLSSEIKKINKQNIKLNKLKSNLSLNLKIYKEKEKIQNLKYYSNKNLILLTEGKEEIKTRNPNYFLNKENLKTINYSNEKIQIKKKHCSKSPSSIKNELFPLINNNNDNKFKYSIKLINKQINEDKKSILILPPISNRNINVFQIGKF